MKRGRKPKCVHCGSGDTRSKGRGRTITMGDRPLCMCKTCGRRFTVKRKQPQAKATA